MRRVAIALAGSGPAILVLAACSAGQPDVPVVEVPRASGPAPVEAPRDPMVEVPGATVRLGPAPEREVKVAAFSIDRMEVTVAEYHRCVDAGRCTAAGSLFEGPSVTSDERQRLSRHCVGNRGDRATHPVNCIDAAQAAAYCGFAGKRLPTADEWEYATRGAEYRAYPWGSEPPTGERCNVCDATCARAARAEGVEMEPMFAGSDGFEATAPVGSYPDGKSPFGLFDAAGNVAEWTAPGASGGSITARGGGFLDFAEGVLTGEAPDSGVAPQTRAPDIGLRCAR